MQSACSRLEPEQRQRQAEAVVVVAMSGECRHVRGAERGEHVLRGRLAIRSGDADHLPAPGTPHLPGDRSERRERLVGLEHADPRERARAAACGRARRPRRPPARRRGSRARRRARPRARRRAPPARPRASRSTTLSMTGRRIAAEQARPVELARRERDHPPPPSSSCATVRSSNGSTTPPMSWPCSWPLPRISTRSPGSASASAQRDRARGGRARRARRRAARGRPRIWLDDQLGRLRARSCRSSRRGGRPRPRRRRP